ncbi:MAG: prepilin peptidase [Chloroflexi bacterium]|nr:prepilin peptidase [Chloroflexota bacterium]
MIALALVLGLFVGGVLNVLIRRVPRRRSPLSLPIRCRFCRKGLGFADLVPVVSYALSAGRCRHCGHTLPVRCLLVELGTGIVYAALYVRFGVSLAGLAYGIYSTILLAVFMMDLEFFLIPNVVTYPSILLAVGMMFVIPGLGMRSALLGGLFYGGLFLALYLISLVAYKSDVALGQGDVKLALLIGLMTGMPGAVAAALLGTMFGAIAGLTMIIARRAHGKSVMPYGTALSLGGLIIIFWSPWVT